MANACFEISKITDCWLNSSGKNRQTACRAKNCQIWSTNGRKFWWDAFTSSIERKQCHVFILKFFYQCWLMDKFLREKKANCLQTGKMYNYALKSSCYQNMAHVFFWWGAFTSKLSAKTKANACFEMPNFLMQWLQPVVKGRAKHLNIDSANSAELGRHY